MKPKNVSWLFMSIGFFIILVSAILHIVLTLKGFNETFTFITLPLGFLIGIFGALLSLQEEE